MPTYWLPDGRPYVPPPRPQQPAPALLPASLAVMARDWAETQPYGTYGATFASPPEPQQTFTQVLPPAPDWQAEAAERRARGEPDAEPWTPLQHGGAVAELMARDNGFDPPAPGPGPVTVPLQRPRIPEANWREEEIAAAKETKRAQREHARKLLEGDAT